ncbi:hypothetical protein CRUP_018101 [Coryphaenoides rupestris]|nr:hypothetical protein CRUP_018101 [Coryphaenoides rupestris]
MISYHEAWTTPGAGGTPHRALLRERAIDIKWEQFVSMSKPPTTAPSTSRCSSNRLHLLHPPPPPPSRSSALSLTRNQTQNRNQTHPGPSPAQTWNQTRSSSLVSRSQTSGRSVVSRSTMVADLRAAQDERLAEMDQNYADVLDLHARLCSLLARLPVQVCRERPVSLVVRRLRGVAGRGVAPVRPHHFLKLLAALPAWQLCLPDLCVAIELVRENVVGLPREEYDAWLRSRLS